MQYDTIDTELLRCANAYGHEITTIPLSANRSDEYIADMDTLREIQSYILTDSHINVASEEPRRSHTHVYTYTPHTDSAISYTISNTNPYVTKKPYWNIDSATYKIKFDDGGAFYFERESKKQMPLPNRDELMEFLTDE